MTIEQAYYFSVALINLVFAFAGTRVKELDHRSNSIIYFIISFFSYFVSWSIYIFEVGTILESLSAFTSSIFVWAMVIFSCKRALIKVPWFLISGMFVINCCAQIYFISQNEFTYYLHVSAIFLPMAFGSISYTILKIKKNRYPSDSIVGYAFLLMMMIIISRSILLETSPELFARSTMYTQIIWPAFCSIVGIYTLFSYTEEAQYRLEKDSHTDQLTGLSNRRAFDTKLKSYLNSFSKTTNVGILIYLDLDGFKPINDQYGHYVGDQVLVELGARLSTLCQKGEVVARLGGDEFAVLIMDTNDTQVETRISAQKFSLRIQRVLKNPIITQGLILQVNCCIGIHLLTPTGQTAHIALTEADNAMYHSKKSQRGSITFSNDIANENYGVIKIGINEIDKDHQEIDDLIQSLLNKNDNFSVHIPKLKTRLEQHFHTEQQVSERLGLNMTRDHITQHEEIIKRLDECSQLNDVNSAHEYITNIYKQIERHAREYDRELIQDT